MTIDSDAPRYQIICADALEALRGMEADSIDAVVTDPPAGIAFMGNDWDQNRGGRAAWIEWMASIAAEVLRVTKPGGHALVWALPRTSHWTATAWEDGGWEVRDCVYADTQIHADRARRRGAPGATRSASRQQPPVPA